MNTLTKMLVTAAIILGAVVLTFYLYRKNRAAEQGEDYAFSRVPRDLTRGIGRALRPSEPGPEAASRTESASTGTSSGRTPPAPSRSAAPASAADGAALFRKGRELYLAGEYLKAVPLLDAAGRSPTGPSRSVVLTLLQKARLFRILLEDVPRDTRAGDRPLVRALLPGGAVLLGELVSETDDAVTIRAAPGLGGLLPKKKLRSLVIARTAEEKRRLLDTEYRRRHDNIADAADCLDLARFAREAGLDSHVTYLMEQAFERGPDILEVRLHRKYEEAKAAGRRDRVDLILTLFRTFFRRGALARSALLEARPVPAGPDERPGFGPASPAPPAAGGHPPSGIGGVGRAPRSTRNPEIRKLLEKADTLRGEGDRHYPKARPGLPDAAEHRRKALAAYRAAAAVYEQIEDRWGWSFESTFQILHQRIYNLMNDTRIR